MLWGEEWTECPNPQCLSGTSTPFPSLWLPFPALLHLGPTSSQLEGGAEHIQGADKEVKESQHQRHLQELRANLGKLLGQPGLWRWGKHEDSGQNTRASDRP